MTMLSPIQMSLRIQTANCICAQPLVADRQTGHDSELDHFFTIREDVDMDKIVNAFARGVERMAAQMAAVDMEEVIDSVAGEIEEINLEDI